jgi:hypothetical protein
MVIKPYGYAIWEAIQRALDERIKATGHENLYFPLFVPSTVLDRERQLVEGFAPEVAVVTHPGGKKLSGPECLVLGELLPKDDELALEGFVVAWWMRGSTSLLGLRSRAEAIACSNFWAWIFVNRYSWTLRIAMALRVVTETPNAPMRQPTRPHRAEGVRGPPAHRSRLERAPCRRLAGAALAQRPAGSKR